ncbi:DUF4476 domain-containing protein [bacterium SCSIO 12741]|nr:DUF4476 domain-containing protein [bacterium SCSIO 12741]
MKSLLLFSMISFLGVFYSSAQNYSDLVIFSADGQKIFVEVNGKRYNETAATQVRASGITQEFVTVKIIFADASKPSFTKNLPLNPGMEITAQVVLNRKGDYKLRWMSETALQNAPMVQEEISTPVSEPVMETTVTSPSSTQTTTTTTISHSTHSTTSNPQSAQVNMNVNVGGESVNVGVSANEMGANTSMNQSMTYSETVTTTTTTSSSSPTLTAVEEPKTAGGCYAMGFGDFNSAKESIRSKSFEDSKFTMAKQIINANCMSSEQVKEVMGLFTYEDTRLDFAKLAYKKTSDPNNYYKVNDAFTFESSIEELNEFINP